MTVLNYSEQNQERERERYICLGVVKCFVYGHDKKKNMPLQPQLMKSTKIGFSHFDNIICWNGSILHETAAWNSFLLDDSAVRQQPLFLSKALEKRPTHLATCLSNQPIFQAWPMADKSFVMYCIVKQIWNINYLWVAKNSHVTSRHEVETKGILVNEDSYL